jgi:hypothetical protein
MSTAICVALITAIPPTIIGIIGLLKMKSLHISLNSRLDEWLKATAKASFAEGGKAERGKKRRRSKRP